MSTRKGKKSALVIKAGGATTTATKPLKGFYHSAPKDGTFSFARFYWLLGEGARESIIPRFRKKRQPTAADGDFDTAARVEVLLPYDAPEDYVDADFVVRHYEDRLPPAETVAYAQVTLRFPDVPNLHHPYEVARAWLKAFYVEQRGVPVVAILHAPHRVGSDSPGHVHGLILPRKLSRLGWMASADVTSDACQREAHASWAKFKFEELSAR